MSARNFVLRIKGRGYLRVVCFIIAFLCIANPSVIHSFSESFNSAFVAETITSEDTISSFKFDSITRESSLNLAAFDDGSNLLSANALPGGVVWDNATMLDSPMLPVTPKDNRKWE